MTGKWALPLGPLIEFIGRVGKKKDEDLELDLAGVNGLRNSDYTLLGRLCSCRRGWP